MRPDPGPIGEERTEPSTSRAVNAAALVAFAVFLLYGAAQLESLEHNFDEGVYAYQARLVLDGQQPYTDFFYHQTPLYLYTLAAFAAPAPDSPLAYRLPSLLATALSGLLVFWMARRLSPGWPAFFALVLFYACPLQFYGLLALPNAAMMFLATLGIVLLGFRGGPAASAAGAAVLVLAILQKPLALPIALGVGLAVVLQPARWRDVPWALAGGGLSMLVLWLLFDSASDGAYSRLIELQVRRFQSRSGYEIMASYPLFQAMLEQRGVTGPVGWNVWEHLRAFAWPPPLGNQHLVLLALVGQVSVLRRRPMEWRGAKTLVFLCWSLPLLFSIVVWEPCWDHYFVQYLPALALLSGVGMQVLWRSRRAPRWGPRFAVALLVVTTLGGFAATQLRSSDYAEMPRPAKPGEPWLTFDPWLNLVSGTEPACGLVDPFNVYGENGLVALSSAWSWREFRVRREDLIACLQENPEVRIAIGFAAGFFLDDPLQEAIDSLDPARRLHMPLGFRPKSIPTEP